LPTASNTSSAPSSNTSGAPRPSGTSGFPVQALQNILSNIAQRVEPSLTDVVNVDEIVKSGLFENEQVVNKLAEFLPEGHVTAENMKENINSIQFKQAVRLFNEALRSGELATIMTSFGLESSSIGPNSTIEDFLMAIQRQAKKEDNNMDTSK